MNDARAWGLSVTLAAVLLATGCAAGAPAEEVSEAPETSVSAMPEAEPTTEAPAEPAASEYGACPDVLVDTLNSASSGSTTWALGAWDGDLIAAEIGAPVPSCTVVRGSDWSKSFYVGGDQALWDELAASIVALGIPESTTENAMPGQKAWGTQDTGFVTVTSVTPGDAMTILGPAFTEPTVVLEVLGDPVP